ncbi:MAG: DNA polymerase III subunit delta' [Proteobacteria bacterium]|nr:DNA polymerase III subunit delta' [Pseudomonadota bacterium]
MSLFDDDIEQDEFDAAEDKSTGAPPLAPEPRANPDLVAHEAIEKHLIGWWQGGTMPHTIIFAGPQGVGKATLAYRLARFLLATPAPSGDDMFGAAPTPTSLHIAASHPVFSKVAASGHPDLMSIGRVVNEKTGQLQNEIVVETARDVPNFLRRTASDGGWRVVVIDEAETLNRNAQNALLKILEEPPPKALLILVTQAAGALIPTIRSRSRLINVPPLDAAAFTTLMRKYRPDLSAADTELLGRISGNAPGRAMLLLDQGGMAAIRESLSLMDSLAQTPDADLWLLAERLAVKSTPDPLAGMLDVTAWALRDTAKKAAAANDNAAIKRALDTLDALERHRAACDNGNLDRRHMALGALRILQKESHR